MNPWTDLPGLAPFVLPEDRPAIERFNTTATDQHKIRMDIPPEPFIGRPDLAPLVLLSLNPGFDESDLHWYQRPELQAGMIANLRHEPTGDPFFFLDQTFEGSGGHSWWSLKLRRLIEAVGLDAVRQNLSVVEFFGYKSKRYKWLGEILPSQEYGFELVRQAIEREAVIVIMRSRRTWHDQVPSLHRYPNLFVLKNPQNVSVSPGNFDSGWEAVVNAAKGT